MFSLLPIKSVGNLHQSINAPPPRFSSPCLPSSPCPSRRRLLFIAATPQKTSSSDNPEQDFDDAMVRVEESEKLIRSILQDMADEIFLSQQVAELTGDPVDLDQRGALAAAVSKRIDLLDESFLAAINAYVKVATSTKNEELLSVMELLKQVVLEQVKGELPPVLQWLEMLLGMPDEVTRRAKLLDLIENTINQEGREVVTPTVVDEEGRPIDVGQEEATSSTSTSTSTPPSLSPPMPEEENDPPLVQLYYAANQLIEDMEGREIIPDIKLLANLVLLRDDMRCLEQEIAFTKPGITLGTQYMHEQVPVTEMAYVKELMVVPDAIRRKAMLKTACSGDSVILPTASRASDKAKEKSRKKSASSKDSDKANPMAALADRLKTPAQRVSEEEADRSKERAYQIVRPGRLFDALSVMGTEMAKRGEGAEKQQVRLADMMNELRSALQDVAAGDFIRDDKRPS